jgi:CMP-N,N'-diacetyllegionaminic acid synthase
MNINNVKILCIIPARSGSKGLPGKNIMNIKGKPMLSWSIYQAQQSKYNNKMRIIVSTDSEKYSKIAREYGAETPFIRPFEISHDLSTDYECIRHTVEYLKINDNYYPDIILHLRPTQPCRAIEDIDKCIEIFINNFDKYDSLRSVIPVEKSPYKMYRIVDNEYLKPLFNSVDNIIEPYNQARQILPQTYLHNGYIDIIKTEILDTNTISGKRIYPYIMRPKDNIDIDTEKDLKLYI